ncbi:hypothetical protein GGX14DRAFT_575960 [Mycena pura]|uniref:DUF6534 domain-containing protein n=1 Tax=Mycena pura TaxID=153505 RepID=A0AAD6Y1Q2_9AGAR|nr:hypothetical protein GGX14DRAFT_575960 [Mycena pura]
MASAAVFDLSPTLGAVQIGVLVSCILFGVTTTQAYIYYNRFPDDSLMVKATVAVVWSCEAAHVVCVAHTLYAFTITDYRHPERLLGHPPRSLIFYIFLTILISACGVLSLPVFFSFRIYMLSKRRLIPYIIWALSFVRCVAGITAFVAGLRAETLVEYLVQWEWLAITTWTLSAADDVTITATMVYLLYKQRDRGHRQFQFLPPRKGSLLTINPTRLTALVDKIILWTMDGAAHKASPHFRLWTNIVLFLLPRSTFTLVTIICFHTMQSNFVWVALIVVEARREPLSPHLFANSLLASLNSRSVLREMNAEVDVHMFSDALSILGRVGFLVSLTTPH